MQLIMASEISNRFGLIGTITHDVITYANGRIFSGLGGILYQASVLCGLGKDVSLFTNLGEKLLAEAREIVGKWPSCDTAKIRVVPGPGNCVFLHYPEKGERIEILESCVPPLKPDAVIEELARLSMLIMVVNSGFDIELEDWQEISGAAECPVWFDVHSLVLSRVLHEQRGYRALLEWPRWVEGVTYLQANLNEVASMLGKPGQVLSRDCLKNFSESAFERGVKAVFITLGKDGVMVSTPKRTQVKNSIEVGHILDTTGCGDVFCAAAAALLASGSDPEEAASFGAELAAEAAQVVGVGETYNLVRNRIYRA